QVATDAGATVIARNDATHRGKGYALDFGIRFLEKTPPDVVVIVDADCRVADGSIGELVHCCVTMRRPAQALYLMNAPAGAGTKLQIAAFAWLLRNQVRPLGLYALGLPCQLMGSGMAFPWKTIHGAPLASGHLVEDLKLGLDLARDGHAPVFCPQALVTSCFPSSAAGMAAQRTRWEHGHLGVILREAPRLMLRGIGSLSAGLVGLVLDLSIPPLALLAFLMIVSLFCALLLLAVGGSWQPLAAVSCDALALFLSVGIAWWRFGRSHVLGNPWGIVSYLLWKLPLYAKFVISRQSNWVRSERGDERRQ
ncbi:MAG: glycosyltransferase, partial [Sinobacteraceae bacterium]|nr:glycosyltransferase [Nevskiaceae bacterium]